MNSGGGDTETIQVGVHAKEKNLDMHVHIGEENKVHTSIRQAKELCDNSLDKHGRKGPVLFGGWSILPE